MAVLMDDAYMIMMMTRVLPGFSSSSGKSEIWPFFGNPGKSSPALAKLLAGFCRIWQIPVQLMLDKTNAADPPSGVFAI